MPNEPQIESQIEELKKQVEFLEQRLKSHYHDGLTEAQINVFQLFGLLRTITSAAELTNVIGQPAKTLYEQIFIDTSTATKKLYVFDANGNAWRSVTIA